MATKQRVVTKESENVAAAIPPCVSGWLVPGLGHVMLGKRGRGLIFFAIVVSLFVLGLYWDGELYPLDSPEILTLGKAVAELGTGLLFLATNLLGYGRGDVTSVTYEYGWTFMVVAGLLNMLIVLDAFDIAVGRKG